MLACIERVLQNLFIEVSVAGDDASTEIAVGNVDLERPNKS